MSNYIYSIFSSESFVDLGIIQFGRERCVPSHAFGPAAREHYLFHLCLTGKGTLIAMNSKGKNEFYSVEGGQGFLLFPDQVATYVADQEEPWEYAWMEFDGLRAKEIVDSAGLSVNHPIYRPRNEESAQAMREELIYIVEHRDETVFHLIGHLYLFLDAFVKSSAPRASERMSTLRDYYIREAFSFVEMNYQKEITVEDIAAACGLNRSYFGKIFHENTGKSPQQFLISYRMTKATEMLRMTKQSIGEIAAAVGYPNQLHFSRAFRKVYGMSPRQWRTEAVLSAGTGEYAGKCTGTQEDAD